MMKLAQIYHSGKRSFDCITENGEKFNAWAHATLLKDEHLVVGDWVTCEPQTDGSWWITEVTPRKNIIFRNLPREKKKKIIAANIDQMMIVMSADKPVYKQGLVDRYLLRSAQWDIPAFIVFNKMDSYQNDFNPAEEIERLKTLNVSGFEVSAVDNNYQPQFLSNGWGELKNQLKGTTTIVLGQSGVGKSKLISSLSGNKVNLLSKELAKVGKGSHTTTWIELIDCGEFKLIDSPGVRSMSIEDIHRDELFDYFPDLAPFTNQCQFQNCQHLKTSKGCYFSRPESKHSSRWESYLRMHEEAHSLENWE